MDIKNEIDRYKTMNKKVCIFAVLSVILALISIALSITEPVLEGRTKKPKTSTEISSEITTTPKTNKNDVFTCVTTTVINFPPYIRKVPLSIDLQQYTYELCLDYKVDYDMVLSIMREESQFDSAAVSKDGNDVGIMQINRINHKKFAEEYGLTDMTDPYQNIQAGVIMLDIIQRSSGFDTPSKILMGYNLGISKARSKFEEGIYTTEYTEKVLGGMQKWEITQIWQQDF